MVCSLHVMGGVGVWGIWIHCRSRFIQGAHAGLTKSYINFFCLHGLTVLFLGYFVVKCPIESYVWLERKFQNQ